MRAYGKNGFFKSIIERQVRGFRHEDIGYRAAYLGRLRNEIRKYFEENRKYPDPNAYDKIQDKVYDEVNMLDTSEHWEINKANVLEQLFDNLNALHKKCRNLELVINKRYEELSKQTDLIDPNMFPIFSLIERMDDNDIVSIWEYKPELIDQIRKDIGFSLEIKQSNIEHHEAGNGVFLKCENPNHKVCKGTLLGFVPGIIQTSYEIAEIEDTRIEKDFVECYDKTKIHFGRNLPYPLKFGYSLEEIYDQYERRVDYGKDRTGLLEVPCDYFNPYAVGHKINHPPPDTPVNVILSDFAIPKSFFPEYLLRYLPLLKMSSVRNEGYRFMREFYHQDSIRGLAVLAVEDIADGEELYCDYLDVSRYTYDFGPDWLISPPPLSPYLSKFEYESELTFLVRVMDAYLSRKEGDKFEKFVEQVSHDQLEKTTSHGTAIRERIEAKKKKEQEQKVEKATN